MPLFCLMGVEIMKEELKSTYNPDAQTLAQQQYYKEQLTNRGDAIEQVEEKIKIENNSDLSIFDVMDLLELIVSSCGGESRVSFIEVSEEFIRIATRLPIEANLYPFMPIDEGNPRANKVFIKLALSIKVVKSVRWIPNGEAGSQIIIGVRIK